jgi:hypothetical protein
VAFDQKNYRDQVLKPLAANKAVQASIQRATREIAEASQPPARTQALGLVDLAGLFAVETSFDSAGLEQHFRSVEALLNKAGQTNPGAAMLSRLLAAIKGASLPYTEPGFWQQLGKISQQAEQARLKAFGVALGKEYSTLRVITLAELRESARASGIPPSVSDKDLTAIAKTNQVDVVKEFEPPSVTLPDQLRRLNLAFRSIMDVVLYHEPDPVKRSNFQIIDTLRCAGQAVTVDDLTKTRNRTNQTSDDVTEAAKKAVISLQGVANGNAALQGVVLAWFVAFAQNLTRQGMMLVSAMETLTRTGLDPLDARRLLAKLGGTASGSSLADVTEKLASGALAEARRLLDAILGGTKPETPEAEAAVKAVSQAETKKANLIAAYQKALAAQDFPAAEDALTQARGIDREDDRLVTWAAQLPPPAPSNLRVALTAEGGAALSWRASPDPATRYIIVRSEGRAPVNPADGTRLAAKKAGGSFIDQHPPVAKPLVYGVFAFRQAGQYSLPATAQATLLPPVRDVAAMTNPTSVALSWKLSAGASTVRIKQTSDAAVQDLGSLTGTSRTVDGLKGGTPYAFTLTVQYRLPDGRTAESTPVTVEATPRGAANAVTDLKVVQAALPDGRPGMMASWQAVTGFAVELWSLPLDETCPAGVWVTRDELAERDGKQVTGALERTGQDERLRFYPLRDVRRIVALTIDGAKGLVGASAIAGSAPPPSEVEAIRFGQDIRVTFRWPHGDYAMRVAWHGGSGAKSVRVERDTYDRGNGIYITEAVDVAAVTVATIASVAGQDYIGGSVRIRLEALPQVVSYDLKLPRGMFGGRTVNVEAVSETFRGVGQVLAVVASGPTMPVNPSMGRLIGPLKLHLRDGGPAEASFDLPSTRSPYWVRLFAEPGSPFVLQDPPIRRMKG